MSSNPPPPPIERPRPVAVMPVEDAAAPPRGLDGAPVTQALVALNVAIFAIEVVLGGQASLMHIGNREALALGASDSLATIGENRWETLVTACFLHGGLLHLGFNMLALWQAGPLLERAVGSARFAPMYLVAGAAGNVASIAVAWLEGGARLTVGASGAISGVIAAAMVVAWRAEGWRSPMAWAMARWLGVVIAFGVFANLRGESIANSAHVGGALAGMVFGVGWRRGRAPSRGDTATMLVVCTGVLGACIGLVGWHDRTDRFATMALQERAEFTTRALDEGRCADARDGERAVDRLRSRMGRATSLRARVDAACGLLREGGGAQKDTGSP